MLLNIDYNNKLSSKNNNIVIFVSNLSQLKNIDFLPNMDFYLQDKEFLREFELKKYSIITKLKSKDNFCTVLIKKFSTFNKFLYV